MDTINVTVPATVSVNIKHHAEPLTVDLSDKSPAWWEWVTAFALRQSAGDADAGMKDNMDDERRDAVREKFDKLASGEVPSGGGFSRLSDEDWALKQALLAQGVKFPKGSTLDGVLKGLAEALTGPDDDPVEIREALVAEVQSTGVYAAALEQRRASKAVKGKKAGLLAQALGK